MSGSSQAAVSNERWVGVGHSGDPDAATAGRTAAVAALEGRDAALVLIFSTSSFDLAAVAAAVRAVAGPRAEIAGCTTAGELAGRHAGAGGVVVLALGGGGVCARLAVGALGDGPRTAGAAAAAATVGLAARHRVLMLLGDGLASDRLEVLRGAYGVAGAGVPLVGGFAGDDFTRTGTWQLGGDHVRSESVVGVAIGSDAPLGIGVGHGWKRVGEPMLVTESDGAVVTRLDDRPALDVYLERASDGAGADPSQEQMLEIVLRNSLGIDHVSGEEVRAVLGADFERRALVAADIPQGSLVWVMRGDRESALEGTAVACDNAVSKLNGHAPAGLIAFDCAARRMVLGDDGMREEAALIADRFPDVPAGGFYTYAEIARVRGSRGLHNATIVLLAIA